MKDYLSWIRGKSKFDRNGLGSGGESLLKFEEIFGRKC